MASVISGLSVHGMKNIKEVITFLSKEKLFDVYDSPFVRESESSAYLEEFDFPDVKEQNNVKKALEIVAAGGHNVVMIGPPVQERLCLPNNYKDTTSIIK